ncbi:fungal-specific transcription factor domain-containing protein [Exophiala viscosa]|uniref:fungal-specific transcription factor domain-containing protein n=1 Tax=Exophiala viscosa TaxID=2486360 RepID=UPI0021A06F96|nr:fungal-specific transcription factor domain-containing protein [Exophiala viscosa]
MSGHQQQRRGDTARSLPTSDRSRSQSSAQILALSIETPDGLPNRTITTTTQTPQSPAHAPVFRVPQSPRVAPGSDASQTAGKVAIPRLKRPIDSAGEDASRSAGRHRVNHACEPCRHRKTKCSGERPICRHCQDFKIACFYADGKRDRVKKQFGTMSEKVADYEKLLKSLVDRVDETDARLIRISLEKQEAYDVEETPTEATLDTVTTFASIEDGVDGHESGAESEVSAGAGSTGALDRTDEDFTREQARATGYMGKNSEITWLQRLREENKFGDNPKDALGSEQQRKMADGSVTSFSAMRPPSEVQLPLAEADDGFAVNGSSYHLDDMSIFTFEAVDPYEMPTPDAANHLFNAYMDRCHATFPVVGRTNLTAQFKKYITGSVQTPPEKWLAILNMIFAIGAKYSHLIKADWRGDERDHLIYFTRARLLHMNSETLFQHPDLQQIQILGLMSFYLLCVSQVNRAWLLTGFAVRAATALGMNIRNDSTNLKNSLKEIRYRVWWALYTLEHRLCSMTGRVNCILDEHCTTPLPAPLEEDQFDSEDGQKLLSKERQQGDRAPASNPQTPSASSATPSTERSRSQTKIDSRSPSMPTNQGDLAWAKDVPANGSLYFLHLVQLTRLTQNIFHRLYNPASASGTWSDIQAKIGELDEQLEFWYRKLPQAFAFKRKQRERGSYEYRLSLGFYYYGAKMTIHRPCLCRLDRKIPHQSVKSLEFNRNSAASCVKAAMELLELIPDEPNAIGLIRVGPWWSMLHWLVQSTTVLMLEITFRANHMPEEVDAMMESSKKAIRWLHALGEDSQSAKRAWNICFPMLREAAKKCGREMTDVPQQPPGKPSPPPSDAMMSDGIGASYPYGVDLFTTAPNAQSLYATMPQQSMPQLPTSQAFAMYDPMMHYDQYYPPEYQLNEQMHYHQSGDPEMEFMSSAYHDDQGHNQGSGSSRGPGYS